MTGYDLIKSVIMGRRGYSPSLVDYIADYNVLTKFLSGEINEKIVEKFEIPTEIVEIIILEFTDDMFSGWKQKTTISPYSLYKSTETEQDFIRVAEKFSIDTNIYPFCKKAEELENLYDD